MTEANPVPPVFITGAPRSGASIIAEMFAAAGVFIGSDFGMADNKTKLGYLTDRQLAACHRTYWDTPQGFAGAARQAMAAWETSAPWGWYDWRACQFLDEWHELYPAAQWIFVLRRPTEVAWAAAAQSPQDIHPSVAAEQAIERWLGCNAQILQFIERHPDYGQVVLLPDDLDAVGSELSARLSSAWAPVLSRLQPATVYHPWLLRSEAPRWLQHKVQANDDVGLTWAELQAIRRHEARPANPVRHKPEKAGHNLRVALVSGTRNAFSETFIQAHIAGLPAHVDWLIQDRSGRHTTCDEIPLGTARERALQGMREGLGHRDSSYDQVALARFLKSNRTDVLLAEFGPNAVRCMAACEQAKVPLVAHFHGYDASVYSLLEQNAKAYSRLFEQAAACIAVSRDMVETLVQLGAPSSKVHYNPCSVDLASFQGAKPSLAPPVFMAVGRYVDKKAPHLTLMAFARVVKAFPEARLVMVGDGILRGACKDLARCLQIEDKVKFIGFLPQSLIAKMMTRMRGFVQHSVTARDGNAEGTPVSLLEASASGLPIVATRHAGIKEAVEHGVTGLLVEPHDVVAMADAWIRLLEEPALAGQLGAAGREFILHSPFERQRSLDRLWEIVKAASTQSVQ